LKNSSFTALLLGSLLCGAACTGNIIGTPSLGSDGTSTPSTGTTPGQTGTTPGQAGTTTTPGTTAPGTPGTTTPGNTSNPNAPVPTLASCPSTPLGVASGAVRLTDRQFRNSVAALFPFTMDAGSKYPTIKYLSTYTTFASAGSVLSDDVVNFADTADSIALQAVSKIDQLLPCKAAGNEAGCAHQFVDAFATKAFRRPLEAGEHDPFIALYDGARTGTGAVDFNTAIAAVVSAVLQSPQFLYQLEIGTTTSTAGVRKLTSYEVASKLSYLYWDSPPDAALMTKAGGNMLQDSGAISTEAERLLKDPRARDTSFRFFSEWLGFGNSVYDGRVDAALAADFAEETRRFIAGVVFDSPTGALKELFDNDQTLVNSRLAAHYGVSYSGAGPSDWRPATISARTGIFGKAQVAVSHSPVGATSVVKRGKFVNERFLCADLGAPPAGAEAKMPVLPANATPRQRTEARWDMPACAGCHTIMDNVGLGMEDMDELGRGRTKYASGASVDDNGKVVSFSAGDQDFVGTAALAGKLANHTEVASCVTRQWYRFATGHVETNNEASCHVANMNKQFADSGYNLKKLLLSVAGSDAFLFRSDGV
jgi:hypothetical protein